MSGIDGEREDMGGQLTYGGRSADASGDGGLGLAVEGGAKTPRDSAMSTSWSEVERRDDAKGAGSMGEALLGGRGDGGEQIGGMGSATKGAGIGGAVSIRHERARDGAMGDPGIGGMDVSTSPARSPSASTSNLPSTSPLLSPPPLPPHASPPLPASVHSSAASLSQNTASSSALLVDSPTTSHPTGLHILTQPQNASALVLSTTRPPPQSQTTLPRSPPATTFTPVSMHFPTSSSSTSQLSQPSSATQPTATATSTTTDPAPVAPPPRRPFAFMNLRSSTSSPSQTAGASSDPPPASSSITGATPVPAVMSPTSPQNQTQEYTPRDDPVHDVGPGVAAWGAWRFWTSLQLLANLLLLSFTLAALVHDSPALNPPANPNDPPATWCDARLASYAIGECVLRAAQVGLLGVVVGYMPHRLRRYDWAAYRRVVLTRTAWALSSLVLVGQALMVPIGVGFVRNAQMHWTPTRPQQCMMSHRYCS
ncbi:hypothetical protein M427DRAFT_454557 [Gonapodya prolifera JEL478]|uniref:Uncharacterized protein n=1 Tax=Gonapodya prolifera (strain JEL478) TaxID=1344416 RepID=A0A139AS91_GONPJ|nr:hypothetical protein M427DRAFT_454557 [Gonapodya prolifera JEL478]|eukprot:KXS19620.1 hypothetical protein M427DRAFT_454557 [Gonapodya prolifera JEL478]